jgi:Uma2 family endonuclease
MTQIKTKLTLSEFLLLPETDITYELVNGEAIPKMSPKYFHSALTTAFWVLLGQWCHNRGRVAVEWALVLKQRDKDWSPVPDLTYISYDRLPADWIRDEPCPVPPELVIEIISQGQTFGQLLEKAADYLSANVDRVWVVDPSSRSITVFYGDRSPQTYTGETPLSDSLFPELLLTAPQVFQQAGI